MLRPDLARWGQTPADLRQLSVQAEHPRTRERFLALFQIAAGLTSASDWAQQIGRRPETVLAWVRSYNQHGPQGLVYVHTGGPRPLFRLRNNNASATPPSMPPRTNTVCPGGAGR